MKRNFKGGILSNGRIVKDKDGPGYAKSYVPKEVIYDNSEEDIIYQHVPKQRLSKKNRYSRRCKLSDKYSIIISESNDLDY